MLSKLVTDNSDVEGQRRDGNRIGQEMVVVEMVREIDNLRSIGSVP